MAKIANLKYLIIGNSAGAVGAAEAIRSGDKTGAITIVSDEPYPAYSRPLISKYLADKRPLEKMLFRSADFYEQTNIQALLGKKVVKLNISEHNVEIEGGTKVTWDKMLLATGGSPIVPKMEGIDLKGVFKFLALDDAKDIDAYLVSLSRKLPRAVVIGGGLIGMSVTEALVKRGAQVTIIEMKNWILNVMLDAGTAGMVAEKMQAAGVNIVTGRTSGKINGSPAGTVEGVTLDDGQILPADLVIVAIGVRPRLDLAVGTEIKINRGIVVDRHMMTSVPDIYACGDVAEAYDAVYGQNRVIPIWPNAYIGGRVAGANMAGGAAEYPGGTAMNSLNYFDIDVVSAGMVLPPDESYEILTSRNNQSSRRIVLKDGRVVGLAFTGNVEKSGIIHSLMKQQVDVTAFKKELVAPDFGLASLPRDVWERQLAGSSASAGK
ncbi:MAG: FAD-dependent oxidoreductase [Dehalococcoidales bacterium]|nr:FAD-dependent oxidoreductase [Dehalococcoidales bacterium]